MSAAHVDISGIDLNRVFELYRMRGALAKDVAFSMGLTVLQVKEALRVRAKAARPQPPSRVPKVKLNRHERLMLRRALRFERKAIGFDFTKQEDGDYRCPRTSGAFQLFCQIAS